MTAFARWLKDRMDREHIDGKTLEARFGIPDATTSRILTGATKRPSPATVVKYAVAFGSDPGEILTLAGHYVATPDAPDVDEQELTSQVRHLPWLRALIVDVLALSSDHQLAVATMAQVLRKQQDIDAQ